jgi:hypothetical protein
LRHERVDGDDPQHADGVHEGHDVLVQRPHAVALGTAVVGGLALGSESGQVPLDGAQRDQLEVGVEVTVRPGEDVRGRGVAVDRLEVDPRERVLERGA